MEFTDRLMATDRSVANYRRFARCSNEEAAAGLIVDLLHWHGRFADFTFTPEKAHDMLLEALEDFIEEFQPEKESDTPLRGERNPFVEPHRDPGDRPRRRTSLRVHDEVVSYDPTYLTEESPDVPTHNEALAEQLAAYTMSWDELTMAEIPPLAEVDWPADEGEEIEF